MVSLGQRLHDDNRGPALLLPPLPLIDAIALAHDLGLSFGHGGEVALNWCMRAAGGFEGNGQTLRLLAA